MKPPAPQEANAAGEKHKNFGKVPG